MNHVAVVAIKKPAVNHDEKRFLTPFCSIAAKADSGDLVDACQTRIARWEDIWPLEKIVAEGVPQPRPKRIFFQSNGIADEDLAVGKYALDQAKRKKLKMRDVTEI